MNIFSTKLKNRVMQLTYRPGAKSVSGKFKPSDSFSEISEEIDKGIEAVFLHEDKAEKKDEEKKDK